jgi:hypothetical protein
VGLFIVLVKKDIYVWKFKFNLGLLISVKDCTGLFVENPYFKADSTYQSGHLMLITG